MFVAAGGDVGVLVAAGGDVGVFVAAAGDVGVLVAGTDAEVGLLDRVGVGVLVGPVGVWDGVLVGGLGVAVGVRVGVFINRVMQSLTAQV